MIVKNPQVLNHRRGRHSNLKRKPKFLGGLPRQVRRIGHIGIQSVDRNRDDANPGGWVPAQKITVEEALRAYTRDAAYASFEENEKGTIARGKLADLVLIDRDLTRIAPETIRDAKVLLTVIGGAVVHEAAR